MVHSPTTIKARRILVADDEPLNVLLLTKRLRAAGHSVTTAENGVSAVEAARAHLPDLVLLDLQMPDLDGFGVLAQLQADPTTASIPVIFVSAESDSARRAEAIGQGGHDFISKPFHPDELLARINAALRIKDAHDRLHQQQVELDRLARRDPLTGLFNRRHLEEVLNWELEHTCSRRDPFSVIMLDIDHFKAINDTFGHPAGDQVLRDLGDLLITRLRQGDTPGRYGGEEFLLLLPATAEFGACHLAEQIRESVASRPFSACPGRQVTISAGVATISGTEGGTVDPLVLVSLADRRLYDAKRRGRNRVAPDRFSSYQGG